MKKLLIAFLLLASVCGAQTLTVPNIVANSPVLAVRQAADVLNYGNRAVSFDSVDIDTRSGWDGTATYTFPISGYYQISYVITLNPGSNYCTIYIYKNGVNTQPCFDTYTGGTFSVASTYVGSFVAGDQISLRASTPAATTVYGSTNGNTTSMYIQKIP
jgi:hypothetical protein